MSLLLTLLNLKIKANPLYYKALRPYDLLAQRLPYTTENNLYYEEKYMTFIEIEPMLNLNNFNNGTDTFLKNFAGKNEENENSLNPKIDISEDEKNFYLDIEIPGANKEDLKVTLTENQLVIKGERKNTLLENSERKIVSMESEFGKFTKEFTINSEIDRDSLKANYVNGVLSISVGKLIPEKTEKIIEIK